MEANENLAGVLAEAARDAGLAAARIEGLRLLSGGASKEMWAFDLIAQDARDRGLQGWRMGRARRSHVA